MGTNVFEKIVQKPTNKFQKYSQILSLLIYGGVNFKPYKKKFISLIGKEVDSIELFPASEGFLPFKISKIVTTYF